MAHEEKFTLELITQERVLLQAEVCSAVVPSAKGPMGILPGHAPLIGTMNSGVLKLRDTSQQEDSVAVGRGFFMISREKVTVIAESAEQRGQIDVERAREALERARQKLFSRPPEGAELDDARDALARAEARLKVAQQSG